MGTWRKPNETLSVQPEFMESYKPDSILQLML